MNLAILRAAAADIKIAHSVFALPFAVLGAFLARPLDDASPRFSGQIALILICMVSARSWAMLFNRIVDRNIDAQNPRTAKRAIPGGRMPLASAKSLAATAAGVFVLTTLGFGAFYSNWWPGALSVPVLAWIAFYSLTKRFTALCHVFLGGALAASPLAAAIAIDPQALWDRPSVFCLLALMVLFWVAGFDIIYALQDEDFDRSASLRSVPAAFGWHKAAWISRACHMVAWAALVVASMSDQRFGPVLGAAVALVGLLLVLEHIVLARRGRAGLHMAFFTLNGLVSCILGAAGIADLYL